MTCFPAVARLRCLLLGAAASIATVSDAALAQQRTTSRPTPAADFPRAASAASVVSVVALRANGDSITGDGVVVGSRDQVATELTMLGDGARVFVRNGTAAPMPATIIARDTVSGIALLRAPGLSITPVALAGRAAAPNDSVVVVTLAPEPDSAAAMLRGRVTRVEAFSDGTSLASLSETIAQDRTGAPVLNRTGELIGIAFVSDTGGVSHTFVIPSRYVGRLAASLAPRPGTAALAASPAVRQAGSPTRAGRPGAPTTASGGRAFSAAGLRAENALVHLYAGEFDSLSMGRKSTDFAVLFQSYIEACSKYCRAELGDSAVEITERVCVHESPTMMYDPFLKMYRQTGSSCDEYDTRGTGVFAAPAMLRIKRNVGPQSWDEAAHAVMDNMSTGSNVFGGTMELADKIRVMRADLDDLVRTNGCGTPAMRRFEDNLRRFALDQPPLALAAGETVVRPVSVTIINADYKRLLNDLIAKSSATWMMNRYNVNSVSGVSVDSRDAQGRPADVSGNYTFRTTLVDNDYPGSVRLSFRDGLPNCLYFSDAPTNCRTVDEGVVEAYRRGAYAP